MIIPKKESNLDYDKLFANADLFTPLQKLYGWLDVTCNDMYEVQFSTFHPDFIYHEEDVHHNFFVEILSRIYQRDFQDELTADTAELVACTDDFFYVRLTDGEVLNVHCFDNQIYHTLAVQGGNKENE